MHTNGRYILFVLGAIISLHYIFSFTHEEYGRATSLSNITQKIKTSRPTDAQNLNSPTQDADALADHERANATFVILARNSDIEGTVRSIREVEERFNRNYRYPYVLLNEVPFSEDFKRRVSVLTGAKMEFGLIPHDQWYQPDSIDEDRAASAREDMMSKHIIYSDSVPYRNMCRFNSGFFFKHELMQKYRWYWRIEPDVHFHCDISFDPFTFMEKHNKTYAFTITMYEYEATIPTLWSHVKDFIKLHPEYIAKDNAMGFMSDDGGDSYNLCHFWSNFEIADMEFWRGEAYQAFFSYLDEKGGFYYERWGDAPVHSIAAGLFAPRNQIQFFNEIGYEHNPYTHCPTGQAWYDGHCSCDPKRSFDYDGYSCMRQWDRLTRS